MLWNITTEHYYGTVNRIDLLERSHFWWKTSNILRGYIRADDGSAEGSDKQTE